MFYILWILQIIGNLFFLFFCIFYFFLFFVYDRQIELIFLSIIFLGTFIIQQRNDGIIKLIKEIYQFRKTEYDFDNLLRNNLNQRYSLKKKGKISMGKLIKKHKRKTGISIF